MEEFYGNTKRKAAQCKNTMAFCAAAELELRSNKGDLEFKREYNLSKKPLQMDLLIIEKRKSEPNSAKLIDRLSFSCICSKRAAKSAF